MSDKQIPSKLIVPLSGLSEREVRMETLSGEYKAHLTAAQDQYEKALDAEFSGGNEAKHLRLVIIEQNAALLCQQEILKMLAGGTLAEVVRLTRALEHVPGTVAS